MTTTCGLPRLVLAACAGLLTFALLGSASAQSLGDLARDEAARRKGTPAGKVYTNADLPAAEASPAVAPESPAQTPATPSSAGTASEKSAPAAGDSKDGKKEPTKKDEAYWRDHMKAAREGKARAESFAEALQSRINALLTDYVNRDDPAQRNTIAADRQKALDELTRVKKEIADYTKAIADLQTDARKEGVPAGWVR
jgi:hypothetical protein